MEKEGREERKLNHVDLWGPKRITTRGGKRYVLVIVDDYSRFTWTLFLVSKDESFDKFLVFLKNTEKSVLNQVFNIGIIGYYCTLHSAYLEAFK